MDLSPLADRIVSWSLGESQALAVKAARGAGYPWGLAEEAGFALRWLCGRGLPGAEALAALLVFADAHQFAAPDPEAPGWASNADALCPLMLGTALADLRCEQVIGDQFGPVQSPLLLVPFAAQLAARRSLVLQWDGAGFALDHGRVAVSGSPAALTVPQGVCTLQTGKLAASVAPAIATRVPDETHPHIKLLRSFAARTYAPATEQSRLAGAGAGTTDND
jgi:hypothetical protein